jgi:hypothetical protein
MSALAFETAQSGKIEVVTAEIRRRRIVDDDPLFLTVSGISRTRAALGIRFSDCTVTIVEAQSNRAVVFALP